MDFQCYFDVDKSLTGGAGRDGSGSRTMLEGWFCLIGVAVQENDPGATVVNSLKMLIRQQNGAEGLGATSMGMLV